MQIFTKSDAIKNKGKILSLIRQNKVFIYPTDTIYGIGCNAKSYAVVSRIRKIKQRAETPFSVIAQSKEWIRKNCIVNSHSEKWLKRLPGPYTLIFMLKNPSAVAPNVSLGATIGVRIPEHWFTGIVKKLNAPLVTTSANIHGEKFMTSLKNLSPEIKKRIDFIVYECEKRGKPSTLMDLTGSSPKKIK